MEAATQAVDNIFLKVQFRLTVKLGLLAFNFFVFLHSLDSMTRIWTLLTVLLQLSQSV